MPGISFIGNASKCGRVENVEGSPCPLNYSKHKWKHNFHHFTLSRKFWKVLVFLIYTLNEQEDWTKWKLIEYSREGNGTPLQYSCLENPMDGGAWWAAVHGVVKSGTRLSNFTFTFHFHALEKEMATHSSVLAWRIPGTGEPGGLPSMGSHRVGHNWRNLAAAAAVNIDLSVYRIYHLGVLFIGFLCNGCVSI